MDITYGINKFEEWLNGILVDTDTDYETSWFYSHLMSYLCDIKKGGDVIAANLYLWIIANRNLAIENVFSLREKDPDNLLSVWIRRESMVDILWSHFRQFILVR